MESRNPLKPQKLRKELCLQSNSNKNLEKTLGGQKVFKGTLTNNNKTKPQDATLSNLEYRKFLETQRALLQKMQEVPGEKEHPKLVRRGSYPSKPPVPSVLIRKKTQKPANSPNPVYSPLKSPLGQNRPQLGPRTVPPGPRRPEAWFNSSTADFKTGNIEDYQLGRQLGQGAYAVVKAAVHKPSNRKVAIKTYEKSKLVDASRKKSVQREIKILHRLDHPNIVKLHEVVDTPKHLHLVLECIVGCSLNDMIKSKADNKLTEQEAKKVYTQLLEALKYCHELNVAHRDLKLDNILIDREKNVKLIDFGFSTCFPPGKKIKLFCGTPSYMAPEIVSKKEYEGGPADVWALGVILFVMLLGTFPFKGAYDKELYRKIQRGRFLVGNTTSDFAKKLIYQILQLEPRKRPSVKEILKSEWLTCSGIFARTAQNFQIQKDKQEKTNAVDLDVISNIVSFT